MADPAFGQHWRPSDPFRDFCQWRYDPPAPPTDDALRSAALLHASFEAGNAPALLPQLADRLVAGLGRFNTVWGVKWADGRMGWEFYIYDYGRDRRERGLVELRAALDGLVTLPEGDFEHLPYFMVSLEIDADGLPQLDLYLGNPGSSVSSGICYGIRSSGLELRNFYFFFDAKAEQKASWDKITESAHLDRGAPDPAAFIWPEIGPMETLVVANKRQADGIYFSRIRVAGLRAFLARLAYPAALQDFLAAQGTGFDHLLFDVGWDFRQDADGQVQPIKGSFYGLL
ncbi:hypothetical protein [Oceanomicrobium pacificus]|uniref:Uncharacterized protein n=1 Tax=Oceanomicrobium pacificus TaxID=2692916 RepID=A0A6B0TYC5_9RHOB|nr:hypothetical protein [Oceanomicrobium pacificus]MXU66705.1 hypothetical protein [Oceanomicrobium pacificus]